MGTRLSELERAQGSGGGGQGGDVDDDDVGERKGKGKGKEMGYATWDAPRPDPWSAWYADGREMKDDRRKREMVVGFTDKGFRPKVEVLERMGELISYVGVGIQNELDGRPFTIGPVVKFGLVRFKGLTGKAKFKEWLGKNQHRLKALGIWVGDNLGKDDRVKEMVAGKVKKALMEQKANRNEFFVDWNRGQV